MSTPISGTTTSAVRLPTAGMDNSWVAGSSKGLIRRQPPGPGPVGDRLVKLVDVNPGACGPGGRGGIEATQQGLSQLGDLGPHPGEGHLCQHKSPVPARRPWKLGEDSPIVSDVTGATPSRCARLFALRSARSGELRLLGRLRLD